MSGAGWRFTDEQGVERTVGTEELRATIASGKVPSSTPVWKDGATSPQPAFTFPELAGGAIAAARRSVPPAGGPQSKGRSVAPPPLPPRRPATRPVLRTLTGIEPEIAEQEAANQKAAGAPVVSGDEEDPYLDSTLVTKNPVEHPPPATAASGRGAVIDDLEEDSWADATDVIPRAPGIPYEMLKLASAKPLIPTPPPPKVGDALPEVPKRPTVPGLGQKGALKPPTAKKSDPKAAVPRTPPTGTPASVGRSKPPPPPRRRSEHPPASGQAQRLQRTLEIGLTHSDTPRPGPPPRRSDPLPAASSRPATLRPKPPFPPPHRKTDRMGIGGAPLPESDPPSAVAPSKPPPAPRPLSRPPPRPTGDSVPPPPSGRVPATYDFGGFRNETPAAPMAAVTAPKPDPALAKTDTAARAVEEPKIAKVDPTPAPADVAPKVDAPAAPKLSEQAATTKLGLGTSIAAAVAQTATVKTQTLDATLASPQPEAPATQEPAPSADTKSANIPRPGALPPEKSTQVGLGRKTSRLEDNIRRPLSAEKTEIMIREAAPASSLVAKPDEGRSPTLEMTLPDHSAAAAKDPAPPESKNLKKPASEENTSTLKLDELPKREEAPKKPTSERPPSRSERPETTDATLTNDTEEADEEIEDFGGPKSKQKLQVPMNAVLMVSAAWVIGLVIFFFVGRVSGVKSATGEPGAREGISDAFLETGVLPDVVAVTSASTAEQAPVPCWVIRQPRKWVPSASKSVPFDMVARGGGMDIGLAISEKKAVALRIDPKTGGTQEVFAQETKEAIHRVTPLAGSDSFFVGEEGARTFLPIPAKTPFFLSLEKTSIGVTDAIDQSPTELWKLESGEDDELSAEQITQVGDDFFLTFKLGNNVYAGYVTADKKAKGELFVVSDKDSKAQNGKPRSGTNGKEVAVAFAVGTMTTVGEKERKLFKIFLARGPVGSTPSAAAALELPANGPGGDAIAPDVVGLADGRWILMWTEGDSGARAIRAQTYDPSFAPIGDPIALSPPAGSFGQAVLGVMGTYTTVAFLQAGDDGFEMWGAVLQCGF